MSRFPFTYCADFIRSIGPHDGLSPVLSRSDAAGIKTTLANAVGMEEYQFAALVAREYMRREGIEDQAELALVEDAESSLLSLKRDMEAMEAYALDVTKALTALSGGGSEMFSGQIGNIFKADIEKCFHVVLDRHAKTHELLINAMKTRKAADDQSEAMAKALTDLVHGLVTDDEEGLIEHAPQIVAARKILASYRNREGNGNDPL